MSNNIKIPLSSPDAIQDVIGKEVSITTCNGVKHHGFVYVVDPIAKVVVLTNSERTSINMVFSHAIREINLVEGGRCIESFALKISAEDVSETPGDSPEKKQKLANWLKENGIEVLEDGALLKISDYVTIEPPYDLDHCYCTNTVVLERLQKIIKRMPL